MCQKKTLYRKYSYYTKLQTYYTKDIWIMSVHHPHFRFHIYNKEYKMSLQNMLSPDMKRSVNLPWNYNSAFYSLSGEKRKYLLLYIYFFIFSYFIIADFFLMYREILNIPFFNFDHVKNMLNSRTTTSRHFDG